MAALWQADYRQTFANAQKALDLLPEHETHWRGISTLNLGLEQLLAGRLDSAREMMVQARVLCETSGNGYAARAATLLLADISARQGELRQAAQLYRHVLEDAGEDHFNIGHALIGLAALAYEAGDLAAAEEHALRALAISEQHADAFGKRLFEDELVVPGSLILVRVMHARGELAAAQQLASTLVAQTYQHRWRLLHREVLACQARLALAAGDLPAVRCWSIACAQQGDDIPLLQQEQEALIIARMLIAQGEAESALRALARWQAEAQSHRRARSEIEILILHPEYR